MTSSSQSDPSDETLAQRIAEETHDSCMSHPSAAGNSQEDECEREYLAAIERLMARVSAACTQESGTPEPEAVAILAREREPASDGGRVGPERVAESPMGRVPGALPEDDKSTSVIRTGETTSVPLSPFAPRKDAAFAKRKATLASTRVLRPAESREQLQALRTLANAAATNSVNAYLRRRRKIANCLLLMSTFLFVAMVAIIRSPLVQGLQGACFGLAVLVLSSFLVIDGFFKVRRLGKTELPENKPSSAGQSG